MEPKILIPVDDSPTARQTLNMVIALKQQFPTVIDLVTVVDKGRLSYRGFPENQIEMVYKNGEKAAQVHLDKIADELRNHGFEPNSRVILGDPRTTITKIADEEGYSLLVIGRNASGGEIRSVLFGSVANYVLHKVKCPVLLF